MKNISKPFFFGSYLAAMIISTLLLNGALIAGGGKYTQETLPLAYIGILFSLYGAVVLAILIYKMWKAIPPAYARTTPGKAVGFMFIPIFQFYWMFQIIWGWAKDWNSYASKSAVKLPPISEGLALSIPVLLVINTGIGLLANLLGIPPLLTTILGIPSAVLAPLFIFRVCDLLNSAPVVNDESMGDSTPDLQQTGDRTYGISSLILGSASILGLFLPQFFGILFGPICSIVAIVLARKQRKVFREPVSMAGLIVGIIGIVLWGLVAIFIIILFVPALR